MNWKTFCLCCAVICAVSQAPAFATGDYHHGKAALVNGAVISSEEFYSEFQRVERLRGATNKSPDPADIARDKKQAMENLISRELLYQEAGKRGIKIPEKVVTEELDKLRKQFPKEAEFKTTLGKMGLSESAVTTQVEHGMAVQRFIDEEFAKKVRVSDDEIDSYYESHRDDLKKPLASSKENVRQIIQREEAAKRLTPYLKGLRDKAMVELLLNEDGE